MKKLKVGTVVEYQGNIAVVHSNNGINTIWISVDGDLKPCQPHELTMPVTVKSYDGKSDVVIKAHQHSLREYPMNLRSVLSDDGEAAITGAIYKTYKCGCRIIGNGTLQFPISIQFCKKHSK